MKQSNEVEQIRKAQNKIAENTIRDEGVYVVGVFGNDEETTKILKDLVSQVRQQAITTTLDKIEAVWDKDGMEELSYKTFSTIKQELLKDKL